MKSGKCCSPSHFSCLSQIFLSQRDLPDGRLSCSDTQPTGLGKAVRPTGAQPALRADGSCHTITHRQNSWHVVTNLSTATKIPQTYITTQAPFGKEEHPSHRETFRGIYRYSEQTVKQFVLHAPSCDTSTSALTLPPSPSPALTVEMRIGWGTAGSAQSDGSYEFALGPEWARSVRTCC